MERTIATRPHWVDCLCVDPPVDCVDHRSWDRRAVAPRRDCRIGPCADPVRCPVSSWKVPRVVLAADWQPALESPLWNCDVGGKSRPPDPRFDRNPELRSVVGAVAVRRNCRRNRRIRRAFQEPVPWLGVLRRSRPNDVPVRLRSPSAGHFRRRKTRLCQPAETDRTEESDRAASPERKEFHRTEDRSLRKTRRNRERVPV